MKAVLVKNKENLNFKNLSISGYKFCPRRDNITSLTIVNNKLVENIIQRKLDRTIINLEKTIKLIISSDATLIEDCNMMKNEIIKLISLIENKYLKYLNEFDFFEYIKRIYVLDIVLDLKKRMVENV